jgi:hypothetical protein
MSANGARGEVGLLIGGADRRLCLTLGALAEIETAFGCTELAELNLRMRALSARDLVIVVAALLRGGGEAELAGKIAEADLAPGVAATAVAEAFRLGLAG